METVLRRKRNNRLLQMLALTAATLVAVILLGRNYPLFHTAIELMAAVVVLAVFVIAWHTRSLASNDYITFIGMAALPIGIVTVLHALAYKGMPVFPGYDSNLPTQLWVIARTIQASAFLIAPVFLVKPLKRPGLVLLAYCVVALIAVAAAFARVFPAAFIEGTGLTPFKIVMEYLVILMTAAGAAGLYVLRSKSAPDVAALLWTSMAFTIAAEISFTFYADPYGIANRFGHAAHFAAFLLIYAALVQESLEKPVETLFLQIKQREAELAAAYADEHEIAETLQDAMAITPGGIEGLRFAHRYIPAPGRGRIGGDFYDLFEIRPGLVGFVIGDVCGKGLGAAMTTMKTRTALRAVAYVDPEPSHVLERVNRYIRRELPSDSFVTALFGTLEPESGTVRLAVAGHPDPVICGRPFSALPDEFRAPPLGVLEQLNARTWEIELSRGEKLILVTDGVLEAGEVGSHFGHDRLAELLHSLPCKSDAEEVVDAVLAAIERHTMERFDDDVAVVALQRFR